MTLRATEALRAYKFDKTGAPLGPGEVGEVICRSDCVMRGYWRDEKATARTLRDGWLWTGDLGSFDEHGFLTLKDRSKDVIISGGSNIYPREVEEVLLRHHSVAEVSVIGRPDPEWGEVAVAYVVLKPGACRMKPRWTRCASTTLRASSGRRHIVLSTLCRRIIMARFLRRNFGKSRAVCRLSHRLAT